MGRFFFVLAKKKDMSYTYLSDHQWVINVYKWGVRHEFTNGWVHRVADNSVFSDENIRENSVG